MICRCGHTEGVHPCHGDAYRCGQPATRRWYRPRVVNLAGMALKIEASDTWACDECWEKFCEERTARGGD